MVRRFVMSVAIALMGWSMLGVGAGKPPRCTYSIAPTSATVGSGTGSGSFAVTAPGGCAWSASSNNAFVSITSNASGTGNGTVSYQVSANTGTTSRTGTITVARKTFTLTQDASAPAPPPPPPPPPPSLDPAYATGDIGAVGLAGAATSANGTFTVAGAGADIWGTADSFRFVYQQLTGDGEVVARLVSMQNTNAYAKAGIMLRDGLTAGGAHVVIDAKPSGELEFMTRSYPSGSTSWLAGATTTMFAPAYLKLVRSASTVTGYVSRDGSTWTMVGSANATLPATIYAGLVVCSHDTTRLNTSTFDSVAVTAAPAPPPPPAPLPPPPPPSTGSLLPPPPTGGATLEVPAGGDLQGAIYRARPGDTIVLEAGATYTGNFELPAKGGTSYVMIRSAASFIEGTRVTPTTAGLAKIQSPNASPAVITQASASFYWLEGLEIYSAGGMDDIVRLGDGSAAQNSLSLAAHDLVVSHCYVHGRAGVEQKRGIALNSGLTYVADSHVDEIKGAGYDTQAIGGWNGPGPYRIYNNYLSAAGEVFMLGGADPKIPNLVPTDIIFKGNLLTRPTAWRGTSWTVKNLFELKNAQQVVVDGNVFENHWVAAQSGPAILFTPRNQGGGAPWVVVRDVQFVNNRVRHVAAVFNILGRDNVNPSQLTQNILIANNVFEDVSSANWDGTGRLLVISGGDRITLDHNTVFQDGASFVYAYGSQTTGFAFTSTVVPHGAYGIVGDSSSPGMGAINQYFPASVVTGNLIVANKSSYPAGNYYPATMAEVGFVDMAGADYRLADTSPYKGAGADGRDPGADMTRIPR